MANIIGQIKSYHSGSAQTVANIYDAKQTTLGEGETKVLMHFDSSATRDECGNTWTATNGYMNCNGASCIVAGNQTNFNLPLVFTMEAWIYPRQWKSGAYGACSFPILNRWNHGSGTLWIWHIYNDSTTGNGKIAVGFGTGSGSGGVDSLESSASVPLNQWSHIAVSRDSNGLIRLFRNGSLIGSGTVTNVPANDSAYPATIGANSNRNLWADGYIDDVRVSHGICRYTANFTPPARGTISRDGYTKALLTFNNSVTADDCGNTWTAVGSPTISGTAILSSAQYKFGSRSLDCHSGGVLMSNSINMANYDKFTFEFWAYCTKNTTSHLVGQHVTNVQGDWYFQIYRGSYCFSCNNGSNNLYSSVKLNTWQHFACVRDGSNYYLFADGVLAQSTSWGGTITNSRVVSIGADANGNIPFQGYIDEVRIVLGAALWTSNFTPPTSAYTKTSGLTAVNANMMIRHNSANGYIPLTTDAAQTTKPYLVTRHGSTNYYAIK